MHGIGEFAQMANVSVRTLRHYDMVGLLHPAHVDPSNGYRSYASSQLADLQRILALKDTGLSLSEILDVVDRVPGDVAAILATRLQELELTLEDDQRRIDRLRARLHLISGDPTMPTPLEPIDADIVVKPLDHHHVAAASETANDFESDFAPIFARLYPTIYGELARLGVTPGSPAIAFYDLLENGQVKVSAGVPVAGDAQVDSDRIAVVSLPAAPRAASIVHRGPMTTIDRSYLALDQWVASAGETMVGYSREIYHACPPGDQQDWVTELLFELG